MLARKSGVSLSVAMRALTEDAGTSRMLEVRGPLMLNHNYVPATGSIDIIVKDGKMIKELADQSGCDLPLFDGVNDLYKYAQADGLGGIGMGIFFMSGFGDLGG